MVCGDFEFFQSSEVCGLCVVWCVGTLKIFKVSWCVGSVLCVGTLSFFQSSLVCGSVVCRDFENFQIFPVCGLCTVVCRDLEIFRTSPVCGLCGV